MASKPPFDINHLDPYPQGYEAWYNDSFHSRNMFLKYFYYLNVKGFSKSPIPENAIIGKDGWLFFTARELKIYQGTNLLNTNQLEIIKNELEDNQRKLDSMGIKLYFAMAPIKAKIYGEYMPKSINKINTFSYSDQLYNYLKSNSTVKLIDLYSVLKQNKNKGRLYYKSDNHWNQIAAMYVVKTILDSLRNDFKNIPNFEFNDYKKDSNLRKGGNIAYMFSMADLFSETDYTYHKIKGDTSLEGKRSNYLPVTGFSSNDYEQVREVKNKKLLKILIFRDSFGGALFPILSNYFSKTVMIFDGWQYKVNYDIVKNEKPDIVLILPLECHILNILERKTK